MKIRIESVRTNGSDVMPVTVIVNGGYEHYYRKDFDHYPSNDEIIADARRGGAGWIGMFEWEVEKEKNR